MQKQKILFFVPGTVTPEQKAEARELGLTIRDARAYRKGDYIEPCDAVAGDVPEEYAHLPKWEGPPVLATVGDVRLTVPELKAKLAELGVETPDGAKKADLLALLDEALKPKE